MGSASAPQDRRGVDTVRAFHRRTRHAPGAPAAGGPFEPAIEPAKTKRYHDLELIGLPERWSEPDPAASAVLSGGRRGRGGVVDRRGLARLLFLANGVTRTLHRGGRSRHFRAAPSAGALYPVEVYAVCGQLEDLPAGVYHHEPVRRGLHRVRAGDHRAALARATADESVAGAPVSLVLTGIMWRTSWKYGLRGYRHLYWDAGVVAANALAAAASAGWPARVLSGFADAALARLLDLGEHLPFDEWPLAVLPVGSGADTAGDEVGEGQPELRRLTVAALSSRRVDQPAARQVHAATELADPAAVRRWRERLPGRASPGAEEALSAPEAGPATVDEVILRRGSTRSFAPTPIPGPGARWCVEVGMRRVAGDTAPPGASPLTVFLAAHAVDGQAPGGYRWRPSGWERVVDDQPRELTGHLCLDQQLGGSAALVAFLCADLDRLLDTVGARGYRLAQLAAGITAGRLQLAAFTLGLGGTGLTFYDEQVRRHFATEAAPMLVVALGRPAYDARPGRRPAEQPDR